MRRADYFPVRPWDLAANALGYSAAHIKALLVIFAIPELFRVAVYFANEKGRQAYVNSALLPDWFMDHLLSYAVSAVIFTGIIRHVALSGEPKWLPDWRLIKNYLLIATAIIAVAYIIGRFTDLALFNKFYDYSSPDFDEWHLNLWATAFYWGGFLVAAALIAATYPGIGMIAVSGWLSPRLILRWNRRYFWRVLMLTLLLMSACFAVRRAYWWLISIAAGNTSSSVGYTENPDLSNLITQLTYVPMDFLFDIVPAVAIGLLYRILKANSAVL